MKSGKRQNNQPLPLKADMDLAWREQRLAKVRPQRQMADKKMRAFLSEQH